MLKYKVTFARLRLETSLKGFRFYSHHVQTNSRQLWIEVSKRASMRTEHPSAPICSCFSKRCVIACGSSNSGIAVIRFEVQAQQACIKTRYRHHPRAEVAMLMTQSWIELTSPSVGPKRISQHLHYVGQQG
eukprot:1913218-Amphidinium_carterae.1